MDPPEMLKFSLQNHFYGATYCRIPPKNIVVTILLFKIQNGPILYVTLRQKRRFGNYWSLPPEMSTFFHFETLDALCLNAWEQETTRSPSFLKRYRRRFRKRPGKKHHVSSGCMAPGDPRSDTALIKAASLRGIKAKAWGKHSLLHYRLWACQRSTMTGKERANSHRALTHMKPWAAPVPLMGHGLVDLDLAVI